MFETQARFENKDINEGDRSIKRHSKMNNNKNIYEDKIKTIFIQNTESYDGIGERMIKMVKEICNILQENNEEDIDSVYSIIVELVVEFVATQPYKTGIFAGVTALMSTSLMNNSPISKKSNLANQIIKYSLERFVLELKNSNYYNCQLLLNFFTELCNFYLIDLNELIIVYRILLDKCFSIKKTKIKDLSSYDISDHNSFILFSMIAYALPLLRDEHRKSGENKENFIYNEIIKDMNLFYNTYLVEYCDDINKLLQGLIGRNLVNNKLFENPFKKYWEKFLEWRDNQYPRIMTILRFYRSSAILDYLSEILLPKEIKFDEILSNLVFGDIDECLPRILIKFVCLESIDIGEFLLINIMDEIIDIFIQSPYETARQLLKIPIKTSSYDLCLSITIWNSLLNPFYSYNICYINNLVINLINLQNSFFIDIWVPIFINNINIYEDENKNLLINENMLDSNIKDIKINKIEDLDNNKKDDNLSFNIINENNSDFNNNKILNYKIFPNIEYLSPYMIIRLRKHVSTILSSNCVFLNSSFKDSFWNNINNNLFYNKENNKFIMGFLDSILSGMSRLMLPQTFSSIPNNKLKNRISLFISFNKKTNIIPDFFFDIDEFNELKEMLIFKINKDEIIEKNNKIIQYLSSKLDKESGNYEVNNDMEISKRFEERNDYKKDFELLDKSVNYESNSKDIYKSLKKRKLNINSNEYDQFIFSKDSLMDLLFISIIQRGEKSMTHIKRLFNNYKQAIFNWYKNANDEFPTNEDYKINPNITKHFFFDHITNVSLEIMKNEIFINSIKFIFEFESANNKSEDELNNTLLNNESILEINSNSFLVKYREIRMLSVIFTIWGGLIYENSNMSLEYNFQRIKNIITIAIEESILTPNIVIIYLVCILSCIKISTFLDISSNDKKYQIFNDYFELIIEILDRIYIKKMEIFKFQNDEDSNMDDEEHKINSIDEYNLKFKVSFNRTIIVIICIFVKSIKEIDEIEQNRFIQLLNDAPIDISRRFGFNLHEILFDIVSEKKLLDIIQPNSIFDNIKKIHSSSLDSILKVNDLTNNRLELKWSSIKNKNSSES